MTTKFESLPEIVCMCGSTRFKQTWINENARLTGKGYIVLSVGLWGHHERKYPDAKTKKLLDELHKRKIDLCDWVWILDVGGYMGESTRDEIEYAEKHDKPVLFLSKDFPDYKEPSSFESLSLEMQEVIKALACYRPRWSVHGMWLCDFCDTLLDRNKLLESFEHKPECAVLKAKDLWPEFGK